MPSCATSCSPKKRPSPKPASSSSPRTRRVIAAAVMTIPSKVALKPLTPPEPPETDHVQVLPPPQVLQIHRRRRDQDRLQGSEHASPVPDRKRQDRSEPHHGYQVQVPAPAADRDQARPLP